MKKFKVFQQICIFKRYYSQKELLKLPVPKLENTLNKFVRFLEPLVSLDELKNVETITEQFGLSEDARKLQNLLVKRSENMDNWLSDWWTNVAYLDGRDPIVVHSNPGLRMPLQKFQNNDDWLKYSVNYLISILQYKNMIDDNKLPRDMQKDEPLCMSQYYSVFSTCRIPNLKKDQIYTAKTHTIPANKRPNYITVVHNNQFFKLEVCDKDTGVIHSQEALFRGFSNILEQSQQKGAPIGIMTTENRDNWSKTYNRLKENEENREIFSTIQQSILLFCLDSPVFLDSNEVPDSLVARNMLHGMGYNYNSSNRWFDKTLQVICSSDGAIGVNYEHTPAEAPPIIAMIEYAYLNTTMKFDNANNRSTSNLDVTPVSALPFKIDQETSHDIDVAYTKLMKLVDDLELHSICLNDFGKKRIKMSKISPDAFVQLGIQLGYYSLHNESGSTYESGSLRRYKYGRTDTIRSCSPQAAKFCKAVVNGSATKEESKELLIDALKFHSQYTKEVMHGEGIDRHLLGLKLIALENNLKIPDFFNSPYFVKATRHKISTSQGGSKKVDLSMCFGPLVPDGYGFCYNPTNTSILASVSCMNSCADTNAAEFGARVIDGWKTMIGILEQ